MGKLNDMKKEYDSIVIPEELNVRVRQEIEKSQKREEERKRSGNMPRLRKRFGYAAAAAAAIGIIFTTALNVNPIFAKEAAKLPVVGELARILTFKSYTTAKDHMEISIEIPTIDMISKDTRNAADDINREILSLCTQYADEAERRAKEYQAAFLETGGSLEEWADHNIKITVSYEIKRQSSSCLSFLIRGTESWTTAYSETKYYNLDLNTGKHLTLKDLLGSDYVSLANESIRKQIAERQKAGEVFFSEEEGGFTGISEDAGFYINERNRPVIVFEKYEIAPGASGNVEFEIKPASVQDYVAETRKQSENPEETEERYEDNFAVRQKAAKAFAQNVKDAAAQKDLDALAELTAFPVYVGLPEAGVVETKEDFLKLGANAVFTDGLTESIEKADIENLSPSMAGFSISDGGTANINFGVTDGVLSINGINY